MVKATVTDFKSKFSEMISLVSKGESIQILNCQDRQPIAVLTAYGREKRIIGTYDKKALFSEIDESKITEEEFLGQ